MNIKGLLSLIDYLEEEITTAQKAMFSGGKAAVDREKCLDLIKDVRESLPNELHEALSIIEQRDTILNAAEHEVAMRINEAEEEYRQMVEENNIVQESYRRAEEIIQTAQRSSGDIKSSANEYVEEILVDLEGYVASSLETIRQNLDQMRGR